MSERLSRTRDLRILPVPPREWSRSLLLPRATTVRGAFTRYCRAINQNDSSSSSLSSPRSRPTMLTRSRDIAREWHEAELAWYMHTRGTRESSRRFHASRAEFVPKAGDVFPDWLERRCRRQKYGQEPTRPRQPSFKVSPAIYHWPH